MVFSSVSFLFFFLPLLLVVYRIIPRKYRNVVLLAFSLLFYFIGEKWYVFLLVFSCLANYFIGKKLNGKNKKTLLVGGIILNVGLLFYFKYTNFFVGTFTDIFGLGPVNLKIVLPLGISFFTFQNLSYLIDVYRGMEPESNILTYTTYIALFPQLVAGPIVRYKDVKEELANREENVHIFAKGVVRFTVGLGKKVLIADVLYNMASSFMNSAMSTLGYWIVALLFALQIYYDFGGYSDMAIGLGKMFGFDFKENFNYPFISSSIREFWKRWHISLSGFFKDYVYIPLKGSKGSILRTIFNTGVVWILTGLWHGADWNFILWGVYFFVFLCFEKFIIKDRIKNSILSHFYTGIVILVSFVIFNISDMGELASFLKGMVGIGTNISNIETIFYLRNSLVILFIAIVGMGPWLKNAIEKIKKGKFKKVVEVFEVLFVIVVMFLSIATIISSSFSPFIYFRF